jgi:hypothetical protein
VYPVTPGISSLHSDTPFAGFDAMGCTGPGDCIAAGSYLRLDNLQVRPMAATESGSAWTSARRVWLPSTQADPDGQGRIYAISCPLPDWCAAGGRLGAQAAGPAFLITESGGTWNRPRMIRLPSDSDGNAMGGISGITCTQTRSCLAVGWYSTQSTRFAPMAVTATAGRWGPAAEVPMPPGGIGGSLDSVACPAAGLCVAVGGFDSGSLETGMEAVLSSGRWHSAAMALPAGSAGLNAALSSVSCQSPVSCLAVGDTTGPAVFTVFDHGRWQRPRLMTTVPAGGYNPRLTAVSCTQRSCLAAGTYAREGAHLTLPAFAVTFSRGRWRDPVQLPLPRNAARPGGPVNPIIETGAVSCISSTSCTVIGLYDTETIFSGWVATGPMGNR